jgi:predicted MFS family arabinose efflux permease
MSAASLRPPLRYAFAGMAGMAAVMGIGRFVYTAILPGMMEELGRTPADMGLIASANYLGYLVGALAAAGGWAAGRERFILIVGLVANSLLTLAMGFSDGMAAFLLIRFLGGVTTAIVMVFLAAIVFAQLARAGRSDLQALHFGGVGVGIAASSAMIALLILANAGWRAAWFGAGALTLVGLVLVAVLIERLPPGTHAAIREPPLPRTAPLRLLILAYGLFGLGYIVTATFLIAIVREGGASRLFEAIVWLVTGLAIIPSIWLWWKVGDRIGLRGAFAAGCLVEAVGVTASVAADDRVGPLVGGVLLGGTFVAVTALGLHAGRALAPESPRRMLAIMTAAFGVGQIAGPLAAGFLVDWTGDYVMASLAATAVLLLSAAVCLLSREAPKLP